MGFAVHAFDDACRFSAPCESVLNVGVGYFAVVPPTSPVDALTTHYTNVCAGLAVIEDSASPTIGLMHVFSFVQFYRYGEDAVRAHAARAWETFSAALPAHTKFNAVTFGGHTAMSSGRPSAVLVDTYFNASDQLTAVMQGRTYQQLDSELSKARASGQPISDIPGYFDMLDQFCTLTEPLTDYLHSPASNALHDAMNAHVSYWIGDEIYKAAQNSGFIRIAADYRFQNKPLDAAVLRRSGDVIVASHDDYVTRNIKGPRLRDTKGEKIFPSGFVPP